MLKLKDLRQYLTKFTGNAAGNVGLTVALSLPALLGASFVAIEISQTTAQQSKLQSLADGAAVAAARELRLGNATTPMILGVAERHVNAAAAGMNLAFQFDGSVSSDKKTITVNLSSNSTPGLAEALGLVSPVSFVTATARVMGGAPVCAVGLNQAASSTIDLEKQAKVEAPKCAVYSNSKAQNGLEAKDTAVLTSAFTCSAGGYKSASGSFTPTPDTDCPVFPDPLASRPPPTYAGCDPSKQDLRISTADTFLTPGVYCGGFRVDKNVIVTMQPGIYIIKDGPISLQKGARLQGAEIGLFFTGDAAGLDIKKDSSISLSAPKSGEMAGLLMYQDRATVADNVQFEISSDDASVLLGTIYLPRGRLYLGGDKPVAQKSAYTIIVANMLQMSAGPTLVLNSDYAASDVPVPQGVGPLSNDIALQR